MSAMPDPISVIAAIVTAATSATNNSRLPSAAKAAGQVAIASGGDAARSFTIQLENAVAQLPAPAQQAAQQGIADAAARINSLVPPNNAAAQRDTTTPTIDVHDDHRNGKRTSGPTTGTGPGPRWTDSDSPVNATPFVSVPVSGVTAIPAAPSARIAAFVPWFEKAGSLCAGIKASTLAALYAAENGFRYGPDAPVSPAGARGPGQFMPGTWAVYGKDVHGVGAADIDDIGDSVMASGHLLCDSYRQIESWKAAGLVVGDTLDLTLAAYNAGAGAVLRSGGMPSGRPDYENQTRPYVGRIRSSEAKYHWLDIPSGLLLPVEGIGARIVGRAMQYLGLPYVWGGGNGDGPTLGGFDCSGLTSYAVHTASDGTITLPRTSQTQWHIGTEVPLSQAAPGDLLFGNWGPDGPGHVAIYIGNDRMIEAPAPGEVVRISPIRSDMRARRLN
jgi:cell wall-associated NlpC family hydrolase